MSIWSRFKGHADQREMFARAIQRGRLAQSYLFVGPDGVGKQLFARLLAQCLLCREPGDALEACGQCTGCRPFLAGNHPDFLYVQKPEGKREIPIDLIAGSMEKRGQEGLCHDLSLKPLAGSRKVAIVNDADTMNEASANSFLKMLEEPPERAVLILVASNLDAVMPTIRSRCQLFRFAPLPQADIEALLVEQDFVQSAAEAKYAAELSEGSLTIARQVLRPELRELRTTLYSALARPGFSGLALAKTLQESLDSISADTAEMRVHALWLIRFTIDFYRSALKTLTGDESGAATIPEARSWALAFGGQSVDITGPLLDRVIDASTHIDQNVPVALVMETMLDDVARITRA